MPDWITSIILAVVGCTGLWNLIINLINKKSTTNDKIDAFREEVDKRFSEVDDKISGLKDDIGSVRSDLSSHMVSNDRYIAECARKNIIEFHRIANDGSYRDEEGWHEIMHEIDSYEHYCNEHPDFPNNRAVNTIKVLKAKYEELLKTGFTTDGQ